MAAPYSIDLREPVVAAVAAGMHLATAKMFSARPSSAIRWTHKPAAMLPSRWAERVHLLWQVRRRGLRPD